MPNNQILVQIRGWFYSNVYNLCQLFSESGLLKVIRIVLIYNLNSVSNIPSAEESSSSGNKDIMNEVQTYWIKKNWRFSAKNPTTTKNSPQYILFTF